VPPTLAIFKKNLNVFKGTIINLRQRDINKQRRKRERNKREREREREREKERERESKQCTRKTPEKGLLLWKKGEIE
jgi:hypothetical protein